ncbi:MAG: Transketolase [Syntrophomonadaceae bacterium]|nr:Transketolase [Bacillota bacterium]
MNTVRVEDLELICHEVRRRIFSTILNAGSGHLGGSSSSVELMVSLYFGGVLRYDPADPRHPNRDRVLVRGHLGPLRYSIFSLLGWVEEEELLTYRCLGSRLQGHETMEVLPGVDITPSGMLGMLLSYGVGASIALKEQGILARVWVFLGDGEEQEGNVSETARYASHANLSNLVCVMDRNRKQLAQPTSAVDGKSDLLTIWRGYGWSVREINDGHSIPEILNAFEQRKCDKPTLFVANTVKGVGLKGAEIHQSGYHTISTCPKEYVTEAITNEEKFLADVRLEDVKGIIAEAIRQVPRPIDPNQHKTAQFRVDLDAADTAVFEEGLVLYLQQLVSLLREHPEIRFYVLTGDVTVNDLAEQCGFTQQHIRYLDVGIREQHLIAMAHGISVTDPNSRVLIAEGEPFLFRAADQIHAVAQAGSKMIIMGTDSGICEARNGATHQTTGQPGAFLNMPGITILEPADTFDLANCLNWTFTAYPGPVYLRLHSGTITPLSVESSERNLRAYIAYQSKHKSRLVVATGGLLTEEVIKMAKEYEEHGIGIKVVNVINMKEIDRSFVELLEDGVPLLTVYNGNPFVLQSAVAKAIMECDGPRPLTVRGHGFLIGTTGKLEELMRHFCLDAEGIAKIAKQKFPEAGL